MKYGLQLYSVRDLFSANQEKTLLQLRNMGYEHIELYGPLLRPANEIKAMCDFTRLAVPSVMFFYETLRDDLEAVIKDCQAIGNTLAVCPWLAENYRNIEGYCHVASVLEHAAESLSAFGITLCYHNHAFEFDLLPNGKCGMDILTANTNRLYFEPDVYWLFYAGIDPILYLDLMAARCPVIHLKDMPADSKEKFTEIGSGILPMPQIISFAQSKGIQYAFVEQDDNWKLNAPLISVEESLQWLCNSCA